MALIMHTDKRESRWLSSNSEEERECFKDFQDALQEGCPAARIQYYSGHSQRSRSQDSR